jgi:WD40 repeat protein
MQNLTGQVVKGYELQELIGEGGFGAVYRATQAAVGREVAVKIILAQHANQPEFIRRFEAEAQIVARLEHLHIVPLYDYWREPSGAYLIMRWLRGGTLKGYMGQHGALSLRQASRLLSQVASALAVAHQNGVIHRDVKPANILLDENQNAYLSDFGIAVSASEHETTLSGSMLTGSAGYISPEQVSMQMASNRSDIYSLGIVLYEMLRGEHPFSDANSTVALFIRHTNNLLPVLEDFPPVINEVIQKATAKDPATRYPDAVSFATAFKQAVIIAEQAGFQSEGGAVGLQDLDAFEFTPLPGIGVVINPYKGLQAFQESDAENFFGREHLIEQLRDRLLDDHPLFRFLAVVGPSGSGKSSVVKAGLIPALRRGAIPQSENWYILEMLPGMTPFEELEAALLRVAVEQPENLGQRLRSDPKTLVQVIDEILPDPQAQLLLAIDQFEEIFTQLEDDPTRQMFLDNVYYAITDPNSRVRVVVTLRADFYDRPLMYPNISELMQQRTEVVIPMTPDELERSITAPARRARVSFEQGLPSAIVSEVNEQPGVLPMLQYALTELFERRSENIINFQAYRELGGVLGALARRADEIYEELSPSQQEATRQLFLRLVTLGEGKEDTRRRALQSEILSAVSDPKEMQGVIDTFGRYRLLTFDRDPVSRTPTAEVAHEAIIREWGRLRTWLDESREDIRLQRLLGAAARDWHDARQDPSFLLRGGRLVQFEEWAQRTNLALTPEERDYLSASITERERLAAEEVKRQERERLSEKRARQRLRFIIATLLIASVMGIMLSLAVFRQSRLAAQQRDNAQTQVAVAATAQSDAQNQANLASTSQANAVQQAALAQTAEGNAQVEAVNAQNQAAIAATAQIEAQSQANLASTSQVNAEQQAGVAQTQAAVAATAQSDAQNQAEIASTSQANAESQAEEAQRQANIAATSQADAITQAEEAQRQANIAATAQIEAQNQADEAQNQANIAATAQIEAQQEAETARSLALAANAQQLLESNSPLALRLAYEANQVPAPSSQAQRVLIAAVFEAPRLYFKEESGGINQVLIAPDGQIAASANAAGSITLWDLTTGEALARLQGHTAPVNSLAFSPDGRFLVSGSEDTTAVVWELSSRNPVLTLADHQTGINKVVYSPDGLLIAAAAQDGTVKLWTAADGVLEATYQAFGNTIANTLAFSPDNSRLAVAYTDAILIWTLNNGRFSILDDQPNRVRALAYNLDGTQLLSSGNIREGAPQLWDIKNTIFRPLPQQNGAVNSVAYSPDGTRILTGADDFTVVIYDAANNISLRRLLGHTSPVISAQFSPDGQFILSASSDGVIYLWDANPASQTREYTAPDQTSAHLGGLGAVIFDPRNSQILSASNDGVLKQWGLEGDLKLERDLGRPSTLELHLALNPQSPPEAPQVLVATTNIRALDLAAGTELFSIQEENPEAFVKSTAFSPDGQLIVFAGGYFFREDSIEFTRAGLLSLWDAKSGALVRRLVGEEAPVEGNNTAILAAAFSPDGALLAAGGEDGSLILWDVASGERAFNLAGHSDAVRALAFSPDGQFLLSGGNDRTLLLWSVADGQLLRRFSGHAGAVTSLAFSPDGASAVSGSEDRQLILWDIGTAQLLQRFTGHQQAVTSVSFSPDAQFALSGSLDGQMYLWRIETTAGLLSFAEQNRYIPELTCAEREQYGVTPFCQTEASAVPTP